MSVHSILENQAVILDNALTITRQSKFFCSNMLKIFPCLAVPKILFSHKMIWLMNHLQSTNRLRALFMSLSFFQQFQLMCLVLVP